MINLYRYIQARNRLKSQLQTIDMMGGEDECDFMILAQKDILEIETTHYYYRMWAEVIFLLLFAAVSCILYTSYIGI